MSRTATFIILMVGLVPATAAAQADSSATVDSGESGADATLGVLREAGGLTADKAAQKAVDSSATVAQAKAAQRVASAASDLALVSAIPRLDLSARYTRLSRVKQGGFGSAPSQAEIDATNALIAGVNDPEAQLLFQGIIDQSVALSTFTFPQVLDQYLLKATLTFPVSDIFLTLLPAYNASVAFADAQELQVKAQREIVALQAREAFYSYVRARAAMAVAEASLAQVTSQRTQVDALVAGGSLPKVDLVRIDAQLAAAEVAVEQSRGNVAIAAHALRTLMHDKSAKLTDEHIAVDVDLADVPEMPHGSRDTFIQTALEKRTEIRAMQKLREGRDHSVTAYSWQRAPHLSVQGNVDVANPNQRVFPQTAQFRTTWDVSAILSWSPNDIFKAGTEVSTAEAELSRAEADLQALEDGVRIEVTTAWETLKAALASLGASEKAVEAAEETHRVREQQLAAGAIVATDLIDAENELSKARIQRINAIIEVHVARARLDRAVGG